MIAQANTAVDLLFVIAREVDPDYAEACLDSSCTNRPPSTPQEVFVSLLAGTALAINASGLCDPSPSTDDVLLDHAFIYLREHGWQVPQ